MAISKVTAAGIDNIAAAVEGASDSNKFTDADHSKLNAIEASATADQTAAQIKAAVESASDSNTFTDADHSKLNAIEASATADQTDAQIRTAVEAASDSNVFTDADHSKLNAVEANATADQTAAQIKTALENGIDSVHYVDGSIDGAHIANDAIDSQHYAAGSINYTAYLGADVVTTSKILNDAVTADKLANSINTDIATGVTANTTANAALPKAGGTMTGALVGTSGTFTGDVTLGNGSSTPDLIFNEGNSSIIGPENADFLIKSRGNGSEEGISIQGADGAGININKAGNVGIKTTAHSVYGLQVLGTAGAQNGAAQTMAISASTATANEGVGIRLNAASGSHEAVGIIGVVNNASGNAGSMVFHTYDGGGTIPERMRIDNTGKVGIGVTVGNRTLAIGTLGTKTDTGTKYVMNIGQTTEASSHAGLGVYFVGHANAASRKWQFQPTENGVANDGIIEMNPNGGYFRANRGVLFNTDTAAANILDDYEEGTATMRFKSQGHGTLAGSSSVKYTKIGRLVTIHGYMSGSISGLVQNANMEIQGLPFTTVGVGTFAVFTRNFEAPTDTINTVGYYGNNSTHLQIWSMPNHGNYVQAKVQDFHASTNDCYYTVTYSVS